MSFKIAIVGSRSITDTHEVGMALSESPWFRPSPFAGDEYTFISGGAEGVDSSVEELVERYNENEYMQIELEVIEPDWDDWSMGHPALYRNTKIIEAADAVVAVWNGESGGTRDSIDKALNRGKPLYVKVVE